ncbi:MAG: hypothetical protein KatS3mg010_0230 [Acidimicrobiia bacterium]|nr:MAG: hypothetical protein KatS3mg010_0230 [Acidimicrobiia bacterium]
MPDDATPTSRSARLAQRRRRLRLLAVLVAAAVVGAGATVGAFANAGDSSPAEPADDDVRRDDRGELPELEQLADDEVPSRPLSHDDPLRVWVGGDSLAGALGPALGELGAQTGIVDTTIDYKVSSGLADQGIRDWPEHAAQEVPSADPEVVVFMIGTNDASIVSSRDGDGDGVPDWEPGYRARVVQMMDLLTGGPADRLVLWIGAPTMRDPSRDRGVVEVNRVARREAERRPDEVVYVDAYRLFAGDDGGYTDRLTLADGRTIRVRIGDGVHFTPQGAQYLANTVFSLLDARYDIAAQAEPGRRIDYTIDDGGSYGSTGGSTGRPGSRRSGGGSSGHATTSTLGGTPSAETPSTTSAPPDEPPAENTTSTSSPAPPPTTPAPNSTTPTPGG